MYAKSILTNSTINRTAKNWKLGDARTDTIPNANRLIRVEIDGVEYDILCRQVISGPSSRKSILFNPK